MGASIASLALATPANAAWANTGGEIGIVDTVPTPNTNGTQGATLIYPGQSGQAVANVQLVVPNKFKNGDTIDLALFDRAAGQTLGQANADTAHKLVWSATPTVTVDPKPYDTVHIGPNSNSANAVQNATTPPVVDTVAPIPTQPPVFTPTLVSSSRANGLGTDIVRLTINGVQDNGNATDSWVITLSGLKVDAGTGATPGEVRVVPFAYNAGAQTFGNAQTTFSGNMPDDPATPGDDMIVNTYTVPSYVAPVTFNVAAPNSVAADGTTTLMGDVTIAETNNFSLQNGTYTLGFTGNVQLRNDNTGDPIAVSLVGGDSGEVVNTPATLVGNTVQFTLSNSSTNGANSTKVSVVLKGLELADNTPESFNFTLRGGSIDNGPSAFLVDAGTSAAIPAGYGGNGNNLRGVPADSTFYNGSGATVNQADIKAPALVFAGESVSQNKRIGGIDRYGTAAKVAMSLAGCGNSATCPNGVGPALQSVVLASGENFPDALSGNFLAGSQGTAILLTRQGSLPQATEDAFCELGVQRVFIVGGTAAVSTGVENAVKGLQQHNQGCNGLLGSNAHIAVTRLAGADRFATNRIVNEYAAANNLNSTSVGTTNITFGVPAKRTALVATGANFPDALAAGPATVFGTFPIILARGATLGSDGAAQFNDLGIQQAVIVGGTDVVSTAAETEITTAGAAVKRIAGADRYETATKLADFEITPQNATSTREGGLGFDGTPLGTADVQGAILSTGVNFADALAGGPLAANFSAPILLTTPNPLTPVTQKWLTDHASTYRVVQALGLGAAVSDAALTAANQAIS
jgi:putative cell wall-binding protein